MSVTVADLRVRFSADTREAERGIGNLDSRIRGLRSAGGSLAGMDLGRVFEFATGSLVADGIRAIGSSLIDLGGQALDSYASFERLSMSLETFAARELMNAGQAGSMGEALALSGDRAQELLAWIEKLAVESPFKTSDIASSFRLAQAYGFTSDQAMRLTQATVDFAAGAGISGAMMDRIALALGQIQARGKVSAQELNQLSEAGINARQVLANAFGVSTAKIGEMIEKGLVPADLAVEALTQSLEKDFGGAAKRQANTFSGLISSLSDLKEIGLREFFAGTFQAVQPALVRLVGLMTDPAVKDSLRSWGDTIGSYIGGALTTVESLFANSRFEWSPDFKQIKIGELFEFMSSEGGMQINLADYVNFIYDATTGEKALTLGDVFSFVSDEGGTAINLADYVNFLYESESGQTALTLGDVFSFVGDPGGYVINLADYVSIGYDNTAGGITSLAVKDVFTLDVTEGTNINLADYLIFRYDNQGKPAIIKVGDLYKLDTTEEKQKIEVGTFFEFTGTPAENVAKLDLSSLLAFTAPITWNALLSLGTIPAITKLVFGDFFGFGSQEKKLTQSDLFDLSQKQAPSKYTLSDFIDFVTAGKDATKFTIGDFFDFTANKPEGFAKMTIGDFVLFRNGEEAKFSWGDIFSFSKTNAGIMKLTIGDLIDLEGKTLGGLFGDALADANISKPQWVQELQDWKPAMAVPDFIANWATSTVIAAPDWLKTWAVSTIVSAPEWLPRMTVPSPTWLPLLTIPAPVFDFTWPSLPSFTWPSLPTWAWPTLPSFAWPAFPTFAWPLLPAWAWPAYEQWSWPSLPEWAWPTLPSFAWPSLPTWTWPTLPTWAWPALPTFAWPTLPTFTWPTLPAFVWPLLPSLAWPSLPEWSWPALPIFAWPSLPAWAWPDLPTFAWPEYAAWLWPDLPIFSWPALPGWSWPAFPTFTWPAIPMPGWVSSLLSWRPALPSWLGGVGQNAAGTDYWQGGWTWVGEKGPELLNLPRGSRILSNQESMKMVGDIGQNADGTTSAPAVWPGGGSSFADLSRAQQIGAKYVGQAIAQGGDAAAKKIQRAMERANKDLESKLSKVPGLLNLSPVTQQQMDLAALGVPQNFADDWIRRLTDEVVNGVDWEGVDIQDAARRAGIDPTLPAKAILELVKQKWNDQSLFADKANLDLFNMDAVKESLALQAAQAEGRANVLALFGITPEQAAGQAVALGGTMRAGIAQGLAEPGGEGVSGANLLAGLTTVTPEQLAPVGAAVVDGLSLELVKPEYGDRIGQALGKMFTGFLENKESLLDVSSALMGRIAEGLGAAQGIDMIGKFATAFRTELALPESIKSLQDIGARILEFVFQGYSDAAKEKEWPHATVTLGSGTNTSTQPTTKVALPEGARAAVGRVALAGAGAGGDAITVHNTFNVTSGVDFQAAAYQISEIIQRRRRS